MIHNINQGYRTTSNCMNYWQRQVHLSKRQNKKICKNTHVYYKQPFKIFWLLKFNFFIHAPNYDIIQGYANDSLCNVNLKNIEFMLIGVNIRTSPYNTGNGLHQVCQIVMIMRKQLFLQCGRSKHYLIIFLFRLNS